MMVAFGLRAVQIALVLWGTWMITSGSPAAAAPEPPPLADADLRVARLVEQLGDPSFATRERAQAELSQLGLAAFDALHAALAHKDIEIAQRARYLLRSMSIQWAQDDDPPEVKNILRNYGEAGAGDRRARMDRLAQLAEGRGWAALGRLARYEMDELLAKEAVLALLQQPLPPEGPPREVLAEQVRRIAGPSRRTSAQWLRTYAATLDDPAAAIDSWKAIVAAEQQTLRLTPDKSSSRILRELLCWQGDVLRTLGRREEALAAIRQATEHLQGGPQELVNLVDWLIDRKAWELVVELAERLPQRFEGDPPLLYRVAEAQRALGRGDQAEQTAARALASNPDQPRLHVDAAIFAQERGMIEWAKREYRQVIDSQPKESMHALRARLLLSELLHDQQEALAAAEALQAVVEVADADGNVADALARTSRDPESIRSRMHYFFACHHRDQGDRARQMDHLRKAVEADPTDADALIAMYDLPDADNDWQVETRALISLAADGFRQQIEQFERLRTQSIDLGDEEQQRTIEYVLAMHHNQLAWLLGNTVGDYDEAVRSSLKSLEYRPDTAGYLDTLAHAYFHQGNLAEAVRQQRRAVQLEPYSGQLLRALARFEQALEESEKRKQEALEK